MFKLFSAVLLSLSISSLTCASELVYSDKDATILKTEKIISVLVNHDPEISVLVVADTIQCRILAKNLEEASFIQDKLAAEPKSWVQCYGNFRELFSPDRIAIETNRYSIGKKLDD